MIGDRQSASPSLRHDRSIEITQQRESVIIGDRQHRDLGQRQSILTIDPLCVLNGSYTFGQRIAGKERHVHDRTPLYAVLIAVGSLWINIALEIAVIPRVRIDQASNGAMLG